MIHYFANYYLEDDENSIIFLSGINKSKYISLLLSKTGYQWRSFCTPLNKKKVPYRKKEIGKGKYGENFEIGSAYSYKGKFGYIIAKIHVFFNVIKYIFKNVKKRDTIVVYHSPSLMLPILITHIFIKYKLVLEVEEIYSIISNSNVIKKRFELHYLNKATSYITPNIAMIDNYLQRKKVCLIEGPCFINEHKKNFDCNSVVIVYTGILTKEKGIDNIFEIAKCLNNKYIIKILGYGSANDIEKMKSKIKLNNSLYECKVFFDGLKSGKEFEEYLENCDIGICPQTIEESFNSVSFPSKILTYLSNGLFVVCTTNKSFINSRLKDALFLASDSNKDFSNVIMNINENTYNKSKEILLEIRNKHLNDLKYILKED